MWNRNLRKCCRGFLSSFLSFILSSFPPFLPDFPPLHSPLSWTQLPHFGDCLPRNCYHATRNRQFCKPIDFQTAPIISGDVFDASSRRDDSMATDFLLVWGESLRLSGGRDRRNLQFDTSRQEESRLSNRRQFPRQSQSNGPTTVFQFVKLYASFIGLRCCRLLCIHCIQLFQLRVFCFSSFCFTDGVATLNLYDALCRSVGHARHQSHRFAYLTSWPCF